MKFPLVCLLVAAFGACLPRVAAQPDLLNAIAVIVNDTVITYKDVYNTGLAEDEELLHRRYGGQPQVLAQKLNELLKERIDTLVENQLILHEFKRAGYVLPESFIETKIDRDIKNFGDRPTLMKTLQAKGLTFENYKKRIREREIINAMRESNVPRDPVISPAKIEKYYQEKQEEFKLGDQVKLSMIVVPNRPDDGDYSARRLAEEVLLKIREGAPFADMAKIYSQGSQSADGGSWGWVERSVLREDLAEKAFALKPGELSGIIEAPDGCYLMLVEESKASHVKPLSEVRGEIETTLKDEEVRRLRKQWIERLTRKNFVRYF